MADEGRHEMTVECRDCTLGHIRAILPLLRDGDREELESAPVAPRHALIRLWRESFVRRCYFVDGEIAAVWGCSGGAGGLASDTAEMWLFTTPAVERVPLTFLREARQSIDAMLEHKAVLLSGVMAGYERAERFLQLLGFTLGDPFPCGKHGLFFRQASLTRAVN
jgi:hypothetical protein